MTLGILVNSDRRLHDVTGLTRAAVSKGHQVILFAMDEGTRLLESAAFTDLSKLPGVSMSLCEHSAETCRVRAEGLTDKIVRGSQYHNAVMNNSADRVIVL